MPNRLSDIVISELSFVDRPAEPNAKVSLFKADGDESVDEVWLEEIIELGKAQPTSTDVIGRGPKIRIRGKKKREEDEEEENLYKRVASTGVVAEAEIHRHFTNFADGLYAGGYLTREERIGLSSAIGNALQSFTETVNEDNPQLFVRRPYESPDGDMEKASREFSTERREEMASRGIALSDGSFPIPDRDALRRAIQSFGRAPEEKRPEVIRHIKRRATALGATDMIPDSFKKLEGWETGQEDNPSSEGAQPANVSKQTEGNMPETKIDDLDLSALPDEVGEAITEMVAGLTKRAEDAEEALTLAKAEADGKEDEGDDDLLKNADPAIRKMVEDANAKAAEAENIAKAEREARLNREYMEKAKSLPFVPGEDQEKADILKAASASLDPDAYISLEKMLSSMNELISKGEVLKVRGSGQVDEDSPEGRIEKLAKARAEEKDITVEEAMEQVLTENPELYDEALEEVG